MEFFFLIPPFPSLVGIPELQLPPEYAIFLSVEDIASGPRGSTTMRSV